MLNSQRQQHGQKLSRKVLQLTDAGELAFLTWVRSPVEHGRDFRLEFLAKIYFSRQESTAIALELVARQRRAIIQRLTELQQRASSIEQDRSYEWLVVRYRSGQLAATLDWLDLCADWLITIENAPPPEILLSAE